MFNFTVANEYKNGKAKVFIAWDSRDSMDLRLSSGSHSFCFKSCFSCFLQSMVAFLKDPEGAPLWEEDPEAKDIVHVDSEKV